MNYSLKNEANLDAKTVRLFRNRALSRIFSETLQDWTLF